MVEFGAGVDGQNGQLVTVNKIPLTQFFARPRVKARTKADPTSYDMTPAYKLFQASPLSVNFDASTINVWAVEEWNGVDFSFLHFPAIYMGF